MQHVRIQTTQNVFIEYEIASIGDRIVAGLLDILVYGAYWLLVSQVANWLRAGNAIDDKNYQAILLIAAIPNFFYHLLCEIFLNGQSVGKKIRKIKVARLDGTQPTIGNYLLRWILRAVDAFPFFFGVAIVAVSSSTQGQRIGDMAAGTTVINLKKRIELEDMVLPEVNPDYIPVFLLAATSLAEKDIRIIKEAMDIHLNNNTREADYLLEKLAFKVKQLLQTDSQMPAWTFLDTVLKDYNHFAAK
jgi:uncharacterized RDD family membrane protein YckC